MEVVLKVAAVRSSSLDRGTTAACQHCCTSIASGSLGASRTQSEAEACAAQLSFLFTLQIVSTMGTTSLEDVAQASEGSPLLIFQLYVSKDRGFTAALIRREPFLQASTGLRGAVMA